MKDISSEDFRRLSADKKSLELFVLLKENNKLLQVNYYSYTVKTALV